MAEQPAKLLTIGGSDSGGAAGVQADLRTWAVLKVYGMSALTAVTAQNSLAVQAVQFMPHDFVTAQIDAVLTDYGTDAVKTGFLGKPGLVIAISAALQRHRCPNVVIDPVLVNHRSQPMFADVVRQLYLAYLLPLATLITPNLTETAVLLGAAVVERHHLGKIAGWARRLHQLGAQNVLIKGGRDGNAAVDVFYDGEKATELRSPRIATNNTHGAGDTLSAAAAAFLAQGDDVETAVTKAHAFTARAIVRSARWRLGGGHGPVAQWEA